MTGHGTKQRKTKTKMNPVFRKVFSLKQKPFCSFSYASSPDETHYKNRIPTKTPNTTNRFSPISDVDTSTCSTIDADGVLIFPMAQRLTASSPPVAILDRISGLDHGIKRQRSDTFLPLRRCSFSSQAIQTRSPYQSKQEQKNLSPILKSCRSKSDAKYSMSHSAWERRQPMPMIGRSRSISYSSGITDARRAYIETIDSINDIKRTESSNSLVLLPPEVSPANKFVPIGCEEDFDNCSFHSDDYDICKERMTEEVDHTAPAVAVVINRSMDPDTADYSTQSKNANQLVPATTTSSKSNSRANAHDKYTQPSAAEPNGSNNIKRKKKHLKHSSIGNHTDSFEGTRKKLNGVTRQDLPPSPISTDNTSRDSIDLIMQERSSSKQKLERRFNIDCVTLDDDQDMDDKYCVSLEHQDEDWFPSIKQEIMKLSSVFTSNCGADSTGGL